MSIRRFKPGERVQHRNGGPVMQVLHYILEYNPWIGIYISEDQLECLWYEDGLLKSKVFRQNVLTELTVPTGVVVQKKDPLLGLN